MKKLSLLLCALTIVFLSCSSDDDSGSQASFSVIGNWVIESFTINGEAGQLGVCSTMENITFNDDMTYYWELYAGVDIDESECVPIPSENRNWEVIDEQTVNIYFDEDTFLSVTYDETTLIINSVPEAINEIQFVFKR